MESSNALQRLAEVLTYAIESEDAKDRTENVLVRAMGSKPGKSLGFIDFYVILFKAKEEAEKITVPTLQTSINKIDSLISLFISRPIFGRGWGEVAGEIDDKGLLSAIQLIAYIFNTNYPRIALDDTFLSEITEQFNDLLNDIVKSNLSKELKIFLTEKIEDILRAIRRYNIEGSEGLVTASKVLIADLVSKEHELPEQDKKNRVFQRMKSVAITTMHLFNLCVVPKTIYDMIGGVTDFHSLYQLLYPQVEQIVCKESNIQRIFEQASNIVNEDNIQNL